MAKKKKDQDRLTAKQHIILMTEMANFYYTKNKFAFKVYFKLNFTLK